MTRSVRFPRLRYASFLDLVTCPAFILGQRPVRGSYFSAANDGSWPVEPVAPPTTANESLNRNRA
jgi:hypothetical protein